MGRRKAPPAPYRDVWETLAPWQRRHLELAAMLESELAQITDRRERRLTVDEVAKLERLAFTASSASASEAGRALVSARYARKQTDYSDALRVLDGGA